MEMRSNPYVGPRSFQTDDMLYGRDRELGQLYSLLIAERIVLLHSPSGAGKTSLIQAGLLPRLHEDFNVLPVARVNLEAPVKGNRYVLSTLLALEEGLPEAQRRPVAELAKLSIDEYLSGRPRDEEASLNDVLIFDQFEEILTIAPTDREGKQAFFAQLGTALKNHRRWALFAVREDYLGAFLPYVLPIPNRFNVKFRLDLLGVEAAHEAIQKPVEIHQVQFSREAADKLVNDLRTVRVQRPDGFIEKQLGQYVEPVQLQVVCFNLWENRNSSHNIIDLDDLSIVGDVDQSLASYYAASVKRAATAIQQTVDRATGRQAANAERATREWFDRKLITAEGFRGQVLMGYAASEGLDNLAIRILENSHVIRGEKRAGATWFELAHDRLIEPIRKNNAEWFNANLSLFQKQAELWINQQRNESLLLRGKELIQAEEEAETRQTTHTEQEFLDACRALRAHLRRRFYVGLGFAIVLLISFSGYLWSSQREATILRQNAATQVALAQEAQNNAYAAATAEFVAKKNAQQAAEQASKALAGSLAAEASSKVGSDHALALLLGVEAYRRDPTLLTRTTLFDLLEYSPFTRLFGQPGPISALALSPDGNLLVSSSCLTFSSNQCQKGEIILWDVSKRQQMGVLPGQYGLINSLAFRQPTTDGKLLLAAGGCVGVDEQKKTKGCADSKGQVLLWDVTNSAAPISFPDNDSAHAAQIRNLAFSPDGKMLASGSNDQTIVLWNVSSTDGLRVVGEPLQGNTSYVNGVAFSPDGGYLLSAGDDSSIRIWNLRSNTAPEEVGPPIYQHTAAINSLAFSPDGKHFASAGKDRTVVLWDWAAPVLRNPRQLVGHRGYVKSLAFSPNGLWLASASADQTIILWKTDSGQQVGPPLAIHVATINSIAFGSWSRTQKPLLISGSSDRTIILWDLSTRQPVSEPDRESGIQIEASQQVISADNNWSADVDGQTIRLTNRQNGASTILSGQHTGPINGLAFSPPGQDGQLYLASASDDQTVVIWQVTGPAATGNIFLRLGGFERPVTAVQFTNYLQLLAQDESGQIIRANLNPDSWQQLACQAALRNLSQDEWKQFLPGQEYQPTCKSGSK